MTSNYTAEQEKVALEVLSRDKSEFYEVLQVERTASDNEIKKAYRRLAIKLHPDKNGHPRSAEAFKVINRAFEVLGDEDKRRLFDQLGRDPDDRSAPSRGPSGFDGGVRSPFFANGHAAGAGATPDDIFDFLFQMSGGGGPFGGGSPFMNQGGTTFSFGPGGFRTYSPGNHSGEFARRQRQQANRQRAHDTDTRWQEILRVLLPLLFFFLLPVLERLLFG
ncbi:type I HSP40 co-chaperone HLJ1 KNAG_0I00860 [Huiozyma naganishii CBS 8797]|uniref:J domain-containing protein n=1 Tax=Huiozyma naganishii (strain ATCC MYA-139 / BCRC 22969 / CBS 8797 / KCTC 17520 / NBRC 10181 / NCYC 3082 / Yp74L-3) TaxID=1071383 RepID=J7S274_HUIN7|nr:hypothetical protein KNAG_0I00860 [Kazachstania naganishii CBS 8797]CCK71877.1 hypothetical protein KNAG_0I00860 [Kazachstania naganishii CBS 8797]